MWIERDFEHFLKQFENEKAQPIKILKGPRQAGKTSLLERSGRYRLVSLDDIQIRQRAQENPILFLDQYPGPVILDEATLAPALFSELKRRVDEMRRMRLKNLKHTEIDIWITGSNQTLLEQSVQESLAGRASYFDLNTLSIHEMKTLKLSEIMLRGGWPELYSNPKLPYVRFLNDLISTFIEKDIVAAAGIERKAAFTKTIGLVAGRIGQLLNFSDIAKNVGVETTTIQSWVAKLEQNALVRIVQPYFTNLNQRLIKTPKIYFEDVGLCSRFQGWTEYEPLYLSPSFGHLLENLALIEVTRFFQNNGLSPEIFFLRSKEKVEVDFLVKLPDNRWLSIEVKSSPIAYSTSQIKLLEHTDLKITERWVVSPVNEGAQLTNCRVVPFVAMYSELRRILG